jgi:predicted 2-oxoglutarate/Fe(II)-dependent dioxygenase YbiX
LNGGDAFDGGGTTFADLGVTCSPETGHAAVFRGDLRHGGAPVTRGVRYVVAAFLFVE